MLNKIGFVQTQKKMVGEIKSLTALRFFAAFYVSIYHLHYFSEIDMGWFNVFLSNGYLAVDFFFILSGFILTHTYLHQFQSQSFSMKKFIIKRLARIYPVHFVMLLVITLILMIISTGLGPDGDELDLKGFAFNVFLVHAWGLGGASFSFNQPSWSVSAEFFAYLFFPFFLTFLYMGRPAKGLFIASFIFVVFYTISDIYFGILLTHYNAHLSIFRVSAEFYLGVALYVFFLSYRYNGSIKLLSFILPCGVVGLLAVKGWDLFIVFLFCGFIFYYSDFERSGRKSWLHKGLWNYLGRISYSFYMVHYVVWVGYMCLFWGAYMGVEEFETYFQVMCGLFSVQILTFIAAVFMYHGVEVPARRFIIARFIDKKSTGHIVD